MIDFLIAAVGTFLGLLVIGPIVFGLCRAFGFYTILQERQCKVYLLFGKVILILDEPGLHLLWFKLGWKAPLINWLGRAHVLDMRLDQEYLRSQPVNSEEGAPMGIGMWYEMFISDPVSYLFKNADPRGSLSANVSNSTVRCLSNLKLADMLENAKELWSWLQAGAYFYVCGDAKRMAKDVHQTLIDIAIAQGGLTPEKAAEYVNTTLMRTERRYLRDVY